jgi:hypothetical protein
MQRLVLRKVQHASRGLRQISMAKSGSVWTQNTFVSSAVSPFDQRRCKSGNRDRDYVSIVDRSEDEMNDPNSPLAVIMEGNRGWVNRMKEQDPEYFVKLAQPQTPKYLYFGCADSRVPANEILGLG